MRRILGVLFLFTYGACGGSEKQSSGPSAGGATSNAVGQAGEAGLGAGAETEDGGSGSSPELESLGGAGGAGAVAGGAGAGGSGGELSDVTEPEPIDDVDAGAAGAAGAGGSPDNGAGGSAPEEGAAGAGGSGGTASESGGTGGSGGGGMGGGGKGGSGGGGAGGSGGGGAAGTGGASEPPPCSAEFAPDVDRLGLETVAYDSRLGFIVYASQPPGSNDWYLLDQRGRIWVWSDGALRDTLFLDLTSEIALGEGLFQGGAIEYDDRGLVGMTFAPDYATSGLFYVAVIPSGNPPASQPEHEHRQIREYRRSASDPYVAEPTRLRTLLDVPTNQSPGMSDAGIHHASTVLFGKDGMLYTALGDGGTPRCNIAEPDGPQKIDSVFGKVLRLDPKKQQPPYAADGNPFASSGGDPRVLHYGLRNPFRFNIDSLTGDLFISDVGQFSYEEVNYAPRNTPGLNFGWAAFEGNVNTCPSRALFGPSPHTPPIFVADRRSSSTGPYADYQSAVAGTVYRGTSIPELYGAFLFGDVYGDRMNLLYQCGDQTSPLRVIRKQCDLNYPDEGCFVPDATNVTRLMAIVEGNDHELYLVVNRNRLYKVVAEP